MPASQLPEHRAFASQHATFNHVWSSLLLEELYRLGVRDIALASGSRSAPLTMAAAAHAAFAAISTSTSGVWASWRWGWPRGAAARWR